LGATIESMTIEHYKNGIKCNLKYDQKNGKQGQIAKKREAVSFFSDKSKKRLAWIYSQGDWKSMVTLTYHVNFPDYKESKLQLNTLLQYLRRNDIKYLWVVEFQGRGFPHYHIWLNRELLAAERIDIAKCWLRATANYNGTIQAKKFHLHPRIYTPWNVQIGLNYATKYAQKQNQKWLPVEIERFGRWWGVSYGAVKMESSEAFECNEWDIQQKKELTNYRRNVKRCIFHWSRRKHKNFFDKKTNVTFSYILNSARKTAILRLEENLKKNLIFQSTECYNLINEQNFIPKQTTNNERGVYGSNQGS